MAPAYRYTLAELAAILLGALLINLCLAYHDQADTTPTHMECKQ